MKYRIDGPSITMIKFIMVITFYPRESICGFFHPFCLSNKLIPTTESNKTQSLFEIDDMKLNN